MSVNVTYCLWKHKHLHSDRLTADINRSNGLSYGAGLRKTDLKPMYHL